MNISSFTKIVFLKSCFQMSHRFLSILRQVKNIFRPQKVFQHNQVRALCAHTSHTHALSVIYFQFSVLLQNPGLSYYKLHSYPLLYFDSVIPSTSFQSSVHPHVTYLLHGIFNLTSPWDFCLLLFTKRKSPGESSYIQNQGGMLCVELLALVLHIW